MNMVIVSLSLQQCIGKVTELKVTNVTNIGYDHHFHGQKLDNAYAWNGPNVGSYHSGCSATPLAVLQPAPDNSQDLGNIQRHFFPTDPKSA